VAWLRFDKSRSHPAKSCRERRSRNGRRVGDAARQRRKFVTRARRALDGRSILDVIVDESRELTILEAVFEIAVGYAAARMGPKVSGWLEAHSFTTS
jgi:hypothetical protein